jgi:hypothetical protein
MVVNRGDLDNPERDLQLSTREGAEKPRKHDDTAAELRALRQRIAAAGNLPGIAPPLGEAKPCCADCYRRGWHAALRSLGG